MSKVENDTTQAVLKYLTYKGWFCWRQGSQPVYDPVRQRFMKRRDKVGAIKGVSDIIALQPGGPAWFIEVKNPSVGKDFRKGYLSKDQRAFMNCVQRSRHVYIVAYTIEDVVKAIEGTP